MASERKTPLIELQPLPTHARPMDPPPSDAIASPPSHPAVQRLRIWWMVFRISLEERLVYRGDFALGTLMRFLPIVTQIFLWWAVYESIGAQTTGRGAAETAQTATSPAGDTQLGGYRFADMVAYYLLTMMGRAFSSMPGLASQIARQIREGEIKRYLIQPVDLVGFLLLGRVAHKVAYYSVAAAPFALVYFLCRHYFIDGWPPTTTMLAFIASLLMGFLLGFFLEAAIGMIGFWFLEVSSLLFIYMLFSFFLSGHMFPLDLLPDSIEWIVQLLPLKYLAYFPAAVFLGKVPPEDLPMELAIQALWLVFMIVLCRTMYAAGVRRYSGFGG
jgi:ABC-2 type transport system permease protein